MKTLLQRLAIYIAIWALLILYIATFFNRSIGRLIERLSHRYWELRDESGGKK